MKDVHTLAEERYVIISYVPMTELITTTREEKTLEICGTIRAHEYTGLMQPSLRRG